MNFKRNPSLNVSLLALALFTMTACSSSQVDDGSAPPPETVGDTAAPAEASTDAVPVADPNAPVADDPTLAQQPAPGSLDAAPPSADPNAIAAGDPNAAPMGDPSVVAPPSADPGALASNDAPVAPPIEPAPIADSIQTPAAPEAIAPIEPAVVETTPPAPAEPMASAPVSNGEGVSYRVKKGDTLMKIAFENYGDLYRWKEIYEANRSHISDPNAVPPGTQLTLNGAGMVQVERNGERYLIKHGDTLGLISKDVYGTQKKWKKLWENNRQLIKDPNKIYAGFYLYYQPEGRLTHEEEAPAVIEGSSASNAQALPFKGQAAPAKEVASGRVPASKK